MPMQYSAPRAMVFPWRFIIYGVLALYLVADLHFFHGPLRRHMEARRNPPEEAKGPLRWVATVNGVPITERELGRAVDVYLWKRGRSTGDLAGQELTLVRLAVREELIARRLIATYARLNPVQFDTRLAGAEFDRFRSRLDPTQDDFDTRLELQGLTEEKLREQFADEAHELAWIEEKTAVARAVTDDEVRAWFEENRETLEMPERVRAAHIFLVTHRLATEEAEAAGDLLREVKGRIEAGEADFAAVAAELSEDERTKLGGGDLGYFSKRRLPPGFTGAVFRQEVGLIGEPFRSEIGWHLVRVDEHLPARPAEFSEVEKEIRTYLESERRRAVVSALIKERREFARLRLFAIDEPAP